jgi:hypothetical protein
MSQACGLLLSPYVKSTSFCWILLDVFHNFSTWSLTQVSKVHTKDKIDRESKRLTGKSSYCLLNSLNFPNYDQWYVPMFQCGYVACSIKAIWIFWVIRQFDFIIIFQIYLELYSFKNFPTQVQHYYIKIYNSSYKL